jgi:Kef-type K+ transport system membrane component KefB
MKPMVAVAIALFAGLMMTRLFKKMKLRFPDVTAFLLAGLLVGPFGIGRFNLPGGIGFSDFAEVEDLNIIKLAALGFIAFSIGKEFNLKSLKNTGKAATVIGILQAVITTICVDIFLVGLHFLLGEEVLSLAVVVTLGAIAAATAPAATMMVVRQYKADGPLTRLLLPIVALDDAVGLVIFAVSLGIAQALEGGAVSMVSILVEPLLEIVASVILGAVMGLLLSRVEKQFYSNTNRLSITISFVLFTIALSSLSFDLGGVTVEFSSLLVCMVAGTVFCNIGENADEIFERCDKWTAPLYAVFFVVSGAELDLGVFLRPTALFIGIVYVLVRALGKYMGAGLSSTAMHCDENVRKYLGITLFPQAGVALGMVISAQVLGTDSGALIRNVILFSVLVYELVGPSMTRWALDKAGEIGEIPENKKSHDRFKKQAQ